MAAKTDPDASTRQRMLDALANRDSMVLTTGELAEMLDVDRKTIDYHKGKLLKADKIGVLSVGPADGMFLLTADEPHIKGELARVAMPSVAGGEARQVVTILEGVVMAAGLLIGFFLYSTPTGMLAAYQLGRLLVLAIAFVGSVFLSTVVVILLLALILKLGKALANVTPADSLPQGILIRTFAKWGLVE